MKRISEKAKENIEKVTEKEMQYKKDNNRTNENLLRSVGIFPAQHPSFVFNQYNDNSEHNTVITPEFQQYLDYRATKVEKMWKDSDGVNQMPS